MKKIILITGSTDGIGKLAAAKLAKEGHEIYVHGRNAEKLTKVIAALKAASNNDQVKGFVADFSDLDAVKKMAVQIEQEVSQLDILINNAGVFKSPVTQTSSGLDIRFAVNYFAPYLLTHTLLPLLKKSTAPRLINLSSAAQAPVSLEALIGNESVPDMPAYAQSKLALTMWTTHLAKAEPDLVAIPVNPGSLLNTNMVKEGFGYHRSSAEKGGDILYDLAVLEKYANSSGKYFDNDLGNFGAMHPYGENPETVKALIKATEKFLS